MFGFNKGARANDEKKGGGQSQPPSSTKKDSKKSHPLTDYSRGGATQRRMEALGLKNGGVVHGPGTGTSDDIETTVPEGSYIMPADSTQQIGPDQLAGLGKPVDVNLSNGEYQMPPEQVYAVGKQALDQMKDATHTPAAEQARGFKPKADSPGRDREMFFADGGSALDEENRKRFAPGVSATPDMMEQRRRGQERQNMASVIERDRDAVVGAVKQAGTSALNAIGDVATGGPVRRFVENTTFDSELPGARARREGQIRDYAARQDRDNPGWRDEARGFGQQLSNRVVAPAIEAVQTATPPAPKPAQTPAMLDASQASQAGSSRRAVNASTPAASPSAATSPAGEALGQQPAASQSRTPTPVPGGFGMPNNIIRDGNSFSATGPIRSGYTINGQPGDGPGMATALNGGQSEQNRQAVANLMERTPELGAGFAPGRFPDGTPYPIGAPIIRGGFNPQRQHPYVNVVGDSGRLQTMQDKAFRAASTPHRGAQNGQLTIGQINAMRGVVGDQMTADTQRSGQQVQADSNRLTNQTNMAAEGMRQGTAAQRNQIDAQRVDGEQAERGFRLQNAERLERLYQQFDAAETEEQRGEVLKQLQQLQSPGGRGAENNYRAIMQDVPIDPANPHNGTRQVPFIYDQRTGMPAGGYGEEAPRRTRVSMDEVNATARSRNVSPQQVIEMLKQQGVNVDG